jgi:hypothetical protein
MTVRHLTDGEALLAQKWLAKRIVLRAIEKIQSKAAADAKIVEPPPEPIKIEPAAPKKRKSRANRVCSTPQWKELRREALLFYGAKCHKCGSTAELHVDHIKPKKKHPELAYTLSNLQILCRSCNFEKGYRHETDYRPSHLRILI